MNVRTMVMEDGERYPLLVDASGMPLYYPTLFITTQCRAESRTANTSRAHLDAIKRAYQWLDYQKIDVTERFGSMKPFEVYELDSLRDFVQLKAEKIDQLLSGVSILYKDAHISNQLHYNYLTSIGEFFRFLFLQLVPSSDQKSSIADQICTDIKERRPSVGRNYQEKREDQFFKDEKVHELFAVLNPASEENPYEDEGIRVRIFMGFLILEETGIRRGELLGLRVSDIDFRRGKMKILRRHDSTDDPRAEQPVAKTHERELTITSELISVITTYVTKFRNKIPRARKHDFLLVSHAPAYAGNPISVSGWNQVIVTLKRKHPQFSWVHNHGFRHNWNDTFSIKIDAKNSAASKGEGKAVSPELEERTRSYLMGWGKTSGTAATYNERHIKRKAHEFMLDHQSKVVSDKSNSTPNKEESIPSYDEDVPL